ncbi:MAG: hypothetical protein ABIR57_10985 [Aeromicrobium sp.]
MPNADATLRLDHAVESWVFEDGNIDRYPEAHFLDLIVGGVSIRSLVGPTASDMVTELNRPWLPDVNNAIDRLLGRLPSEDLAPGRVALLVCAIEGDLGCGQLTTRLDVGVEKISWSKFQWEDGIWDPRPVDGLEDPLLFDRIEYERAFIDAYERVAAFGYDELAHHGRRFLWPWQWGWKLPRE